MSEQRKSIVQQVNAALRANDLETFLGSKTRGFVYHLSTTPLAFQLDPLGLLKLWLGPFRIWRARSIRELQFPLTGHPESAQKLRDLIFTAQLNPSYAHLFTQGKTA